MRLRTDRLLLYDQICELPATAFSHPTLFLNPSSLEVLFVNQEAAPTHNHLTPWVLVHTSCALAERFKASHTFHPAIVRSLFAVLTSIWPTRHLHSTIYLRWCGWSAHDLDSRRCGIWDQSLTKRNIQSAMSVLATIDRGFILRTNLQSQIRIHLYNTQNSSQIL